MEPRHRGGGHQSRKHHLQTITRRKSSLPCRSPPPRSAEGDQPPISTLRMGRLTTPRGGAGAPDATRQHPSCIPVQYPRCVRFPGRFQDSAVKCSMRPRIYCSPTAALVACGTAARRLSGTPFGDTPICIGFRGWGRNRKKWTERPGHSAAVTSSDFEYLVIPSSSAGQRT